MNTGAGIATSTYGYDYQNNRVAQYAGGITTIYVNKLYSTNSASTTKHIFAGNDLIAVVERTTATTTHIVHTDHLGGTNAITDADGDIVQALDYYPYGDRRINSGTDVSKREYIGEMYDAESGLNYLNARYYQSSRGQFLSEDPVFWEIGQTKDGKVVLIDPQSMNSYSYAGNNPILKKDPNGRQYYDVNSGFAFPQCFCGPVGGFYIAPGTSDPIVYFGITVGPPGYSGSVMYSPTGSPQEGWSGSVSGFTNKGIGGQVGTPQNGGRMPSMEFGVGTPGINGSITYSIQLSKLLYTLGGPLEHMTTPMTTNQTINKNYSDQGFGFNSGASTLQFRINAVNTYNSSVGATSNESKLWTTPNGAVVTWYGQVMSSAPQSTPSTKK